MSLHMSSVALRPTAPISGTQSAPATTATTIIQPTVPARPGTHAHSGDSERLSTGAIVLVAIALVLLAAAAAWALARARAYEPRWLLSLRHAMAEAGYRMSATWAEFLDWARLGR